MTFRGIFRPLRAVALGVGLATALALPAAAELSQPPAAAARLLPTNAPAGPAAPEHPAAERLSYKTAAYGTERPRADYVLVHKEERSLRLFWEGEEIARFPVKLGKAPVGHKRFEGDNRTPEGIYYIDWRNPESSYFRSLRISYPNSEDRAHAETLGRSPGSMIMLHGMPNDVAYRQEVLDQDNWTNGCIALSDGDMLAVWDMVEVGTPIEIRP